MKPMAEETKKIIEYPMLDFEDINTYFGRLDNLRSHNIEVIGIIRGVKFSNMSGESSKESYNNALIASLNEDELTKSLSERDAKLTEIGNQQMELFIVESMLKPNLSVDEIVLFLEKLGSLAKETTHMKLEINKSFGNIINLALIKAGYTPISKELAFSSHQEEMSGTMGVDFEGKRLSGDYRAYVPSEALYSINGNSEQLATYIIENAMLQFNEGKIDHILGSFCLEYLAKKEKEKNLAQPTL
jgi:hypothetical protein